MREAAEAAAAAASDASRKVAAAAVVDAPPLAKKPRRPPNPSAAPTVVDPADVARKSAAILEKRGYAAAAVARACAAHAPSNDDASQPFNEQKRRFVAAASEWMLRNSELFALPKDVVEDARARREQASAGEGEHRVRRALETNPAVNDGARLSDRARRLIANGILPIEEEHLAAASASGENANANAAATAATTMTTTTRGAAGADAQDRDRTGLSLRARRLERAAARARDLCAFVATGAPCPRGDACRRLHDVDAYLTNKPADVPDRVCPHVERGLRCPHGLRCRFAGTHAEDEAAPGKVGKTTPAGDDESETFAYGFERNALGDDLQRALARNARALPRSDAVLREMGIELRCLSRAQAAARNDARAGVTSRGGYLGAREPPSDANPRDGARRVDFRGKLYVAPLTTVGNLPFRRVCVGLGADVTISEMAMASNVLKGDRGEWCVFCTLVPVRPRRRCERRSLRTFAVVSLRPHLGFNTRPRRLSTPTDAFELHPDIASYGRALLRRHPSEKLFGAQVCGGWPDLLARCGELLDDELDCDFVDVNMGCPIDGVCAKGAGSSLLRDAEGVARMERVVRAASRSMRRAPLTIKLRMGYDDDPSKHVAHEIVARAKSWGAHAVTLHGRTRQQRYSRAADWAYVERCAAAARETSTPLIGNGDVFSSADYERHMSSGSLATCMIGRGALIKPWVLTEIKERRVWDISARERLDLFERFGAFGLEHWGADEKGVETTRRFMLEWMSYTHRYVPVGLLERGVSQTMALRPPAYVGRSDLETLLASDKTEDWRRVARMFLGPEAPGFRFVPKHRSNSYSAACDAAAAARGVGGGGGEEEDDDGEEEEEENG